MNPLLRAALSDPAADAPRLVYADWLDEHGDPARAEFIRVQVELAAPFDKARPRPALSRRRLRERERELLDGHNWHRWAGPAAAMWESMGDTAGDWWEHFTFRRGFVESVTCATAAYLAHALALFAAHPVTAVTLTDREPLYCRADPNWPEQVDQYRWWKQTSRREDTRYLLPPEVFDRLGGVNDASARKEWDTVTPDNWCWQYPTEADALAALSRVLVAHGRSLAGLDPPPVTAPPATAPAGADRPA